MRNQSFELLLSDIWDLNRRERDHNDLGRTLIQWSFWREINGSKLPVEEVKELSAALRSGATGPEQI